MFMKKLLTGLGFALLCILNFNTSAYASHQTGASLTYAAVAPGPYIVTLKFYRDCTGAPEAATYPLKVISGGCSSNRPIINMQKVGAGVTASPYCSATLNTCSNTNINYQLFTYQTTISFTQAEMACPTWVLSVTFNDGNRPNVANIMGIPAMYVEATLNMNNGIINNSPQFNLHTPPVLIMNQVTLVNVSSTAYDADDDSLAYSLIPALSAANTPVAYSQGYTYLNPVQSITGFSLNPKTGFMSFIAPAYSTVSAYMMNRYTVAVQVEEWRKINGVVTKIGSIMRDFQVCIVDGMQNQNPTFSAITANSQPISTNDLIYLRPGTPLTLELSATDSNPSDVLQLDTDVVTNLPGATFTTAAGTPNTGTITWTPTASDVRDNPYYFTIKASDNACPLKGFETRTLSVKVQNTGSVTGLKEKTARNNSFIAFPNPFQKEVSFRFSTKTSTGTEIIIYNALGLEVDKIQVKASEAGKEVKWLNAGKYASGQYLAKLIAGNEVRETIKFTKL